MQPLTADVAVLGAGPAGSAAARLLSSWGHSVVLLGRPTRHPPMAESLPPSCTKLFEELGIRHVVDGAGFLRSTGNTVRWAGRDTRIEPFDAGVSGYQVSRDELDALLATAAQAEGALVHRDSSTRDVATDGDEWRVSFDLASGPGEVRARWVLDCTGRAGVLARRGLRKPNPGARTTAVVGIWERDGDWPVDEPSHTLVESYPGGWAWSVPVSQRRRFVTVMLDPSVTDLPGRAQLRDAYATELARTSLLHELVAGATPIGDVWGSDASPYSSTRVADGGVLLIGDAASFVDPLSSFGVKKALASAWLGSVVVHTAITDSSMTSPATELFAERERAMYDHLQRQSASLSLEAAGAHAGTFWSARGESAPEDRSEDLDVAALRADPRVLAAFESLKRRSSVRLRLADTVRFVKRAVVRGRRVVLEDHLVAPAVHDGARYCRNVDLVLITRLAPQFDQVPDLFDAYNRAAPPAPLPDFLGALSALVGLDLLLFA